MPPASHKSCDVCVVNYNAGALLRDCLGSLRGQQVARVYLIDNASSDGSVDGIEEAASGLDLRIIRNTANLGFAAACNQVIDASDADHLLFLNPDATVEPGAVARLAEVLESSTDIGMVGALICNSDGTEQAGGRRRFPTPEKAFSKAFGLVHFKGGDAGGKRFAGYDLHRAPLPAEPIDVDAVSGSCMMVKRIMIDAVGPWDPEYFLHCEDFDWCMRCRRAGFRIMFVPDARVIHVGGACSVGRPLFVEWHKHLGMVRFYRKFYRPEYPALLWPLVVCGVWARFAVVAAATVVRRVFAGSRAG